jgi:hypothetical protein
LIIALRLRPQPLAGAVRGNVFFGQVVLDRVDEGGQDVGGGLPNRPIPSASTTTGIGDLSACARSARISPRSASSGG